MQMWLIKNHDVKDAAKQTMTSRPAVSDLKTSNVITVAYQAISKRFAESWLQIKQKIRIRVITQQRRIDLQDLQDPADQHQDPNLDQGAKPDLKHLNITGQEITQETETKVTSLAVSSSC